MCVTYLRACAVVRIALYAAVSYANPAKAERELDWRAEYDLVRMCEDVWRWQSKNPTGFRD